MGGEIRHEALEQPRGVGFGGVLFAVAQYDEQHSTKEVDRAHDAGLADNERIRSACLCSKVGAAAAEEGTTWSLLLLLL